MTVLCSDLFYSCAVGKRYR